MVYTCCLMCLHFCFVLEAQNPRLDENYNVLMCSCVCVTNVVFYNYFAYGVKDLVYLFSFLLLLLYLFVCLFLHWLCCFSMYICKAIVIGVYLPQTRNT